jgi:hypothetical protein
MPEVPSDPEIYDAGSASGLPTSPGPLPSSPAPEAVQEPQPGGPVEESGSEQQDPPIEFDPRWRQEFSGLLYVGKLEDTFQWLGHQFRIRTLKSGEMLEVALIVKRYEGTIGAARAYANAIAAACLVEVDRKGLPIPITTDPDDTPFLNRFEYVNSNYHALVIDAVYDRYVELEAKVGDIIQAMGKAVG